MWVCGEVGGDVCRWDVVNSMDIQGFSQRKFNGEWAELAYLQYLPEHSWQLCMRA